MRAALKNCQGIAMVVVMMMMLLLLSISGASLLFSGLNLKATANLKTGSGAIHVADAGIQHGLAVIPWGTEFDSLLAGSVTGFPCKNSSGTAGTCDGVTFQPRLSGSLSGYAYTVIVDDDADGGTPVALTDDVNKLVMITSTATGPNSSNRKIKAYIGRSSASFVPPGAVYLPSTTTQQDWDLVNNFFIDGSDYNINATSPTTNPKVPGIATTSSAVKTNIVNSLTGANKLNKVQGLGYVPGPPIVTSVAVTNTVIDVNQIAQGFIDNALPANTYSTGLTKNASSCPNPPAVQPATCILGTDLIPQITYINNGASLYGTVTGSGVLIAKGRVRFGDNFAFNGLVIQLLPDVELGDAELEFKMEGNAKIYGSMMLGPQGEELEFEMKGTSSFYYSTQALNLVRDHLTWGPLLPKPAKLIGWHEVMQ